jgi:hypothetical protein
MKPDDGGGHVDGTKECRGPFIISGGKASEWLEVCEEIFHQLAEFLPLFIVCPLPCEVHFWWNHHLHPSVVLPYLYCTP